MSLGGRSLRIRLLLWYTAVLGLVLITFAAVAVWSVWRSHLADLDAELTWAAEQLGGAVSRDPGGGYEVNLAAVASAGFGAADDAPHYAIWSLDGALIDRSDAGIESAFPAPGSRTRGGRRDVVVPAPQAVVLVGRSLTGVYQEVQETAFGLAAAGLVALLIASVGGWWLVGRALAPIDRIARTAETMSASNLGRRIETTDIEHELAALAEALNRAFDRLQDAFERQTRFTADASHELRTPLASQLAEIEWALSRPRAADEYAAALRVCLRAAERMRTVVDGLLTLARADAGALPLQRSQVDLLEIVRETTTGLEPRAVERAIRLRVDGVPAVVDGDPDRLRDLVSNLVTNALEHCTAATEVTCSTSVLDAEVRLEIADTGPGIDPKDVSRIFERFYRASESRSRSAGGAGLGLSICKWIVERHGGRIRCESRRGVGTRFIIELPRTA